MTVRRKQQGPCVAEQRFKTLRAARDAGWFESRSGEYYGPTMTLKGHALLHPTTAQRAKSKTEWKSEGMQPVDLDAFHAELYSRRDGARGHYRVYRDDQVRPIKTPRIEPAKEIDLFIALMTVTRAAKRQRDGAQRAYESRAHSMAALLKARKEELYALKDQSIAHLLRQGRLVHVEYHRFGEQFASVVTTLDGKHRFHVPCPPPSVLPEQLAAISDIGEQIDAKPPDRGVRLMDAVHTLTEFLSGRGHIETYKWPPPTRPRQLRWCYSCGETAFDAQLRFCEACGRWAGSRAGSRNERDYEDYDEDIDDA